ncbi:YqcC family protein [Pseudomonas sp. ZM23]|uniref:YqcC family protein n=1 Tax=Pseudomonas triclosanedens TaxID=2961893 RepID=A0ABY6ZV21_9PSED|nr:YqcC family protein [Pseudomonas triclosanedens]MCP8465471.1 YqcC family protein [Pseudomonas triclosanedens]MCP8470589.1 YqcC family protein [Pseudomonas triclosanedens]MCP8476770.1 YqcC family protein [Pseudomonas triclosanedens]WAI48782.1 YqcC family protein [Pseudomonas triclosanedens]
MDSRVPAIADQLLLIERLLRELDLWGAEMPSQEALSSLEPFCVDTLALEEWLQWIFLPRMKQIVESDGQLPSASGIRAIAEMAYVSEGERMRGLLEALGEFDRLIAGEA